jgi:nitrogen fixation/metabolism regulation signal transduction histidine kinase
MVSDSGSNGQHEVGIEVVDGGKGFSKAALEHGFEPFFTEKSVGVGLGLTAAKKIADSQPGRLELRHGPPGIVRILLPSEPFQA